MARDDEGIGAVENVSCRNRRDSVRVVVDRAWNGYDPLPQAGLHIWAADARGAARGREIVKVRADLGIVVAPAISTGTREPTGSGSA